MVLNNFFLASLAQFTLVCLKFGRSIHAFGQIFGLKKGACGNFW